MGRIVGRNADLNAIARNHADPEAPNTARQLGGDGLAGVEGDLVATAAENLPDLAGCLNKIVSCHGRGG